MKLSHSWREIAEVLHQQARPTPEYYVLCTIAGMVATFGLLMNNGTAIIGAVLIAPLMGPILGISFSTLTGRRKSTLQATFTLCLGITVILAISYLVSLPFLNVGITDEMVSRTKPTLLNLLIAFPAGFLAGYTRIRKSFSDKVYGVAMSVTTLPPLCIAGIALAQGQLTLVRGAVVMFLSNFMGILFSSFLAFSLSELRRLQRKHINRLVFPSLLLLVMSIPLTFSFFEVAETHRLQTTILKALEVENAVFPHMEVTDLDIDLLQKPIQVSVTLRTSVDTASPQNHSTYTVESIQQKIKLIQSQITQQFGKPIALTMHLLPVQTFHAVVP